MCKNDMKVKEKLCEEWRKLVRGGGKRVGKIMGGHLLKHTVSMHENVLQGTHYSRIANWSFKKRFVMKYKNNKSKLQGWMTTQFECWVYKDPTTPPSSARLYLSRTGETIVILAMFLWLRQRYRRKNGGPWQSSVADQARVEESRGMLRWIFWWSWGTITIQKNVIFFHRVINYNLMKIHEKDWTFP